MAVTLKPIELMRAAVASFGGAWCAQWITTQDAFWWTIVVGLASALGTLIVLFGFEMLWEWTRNRPSDRPDVRERQDQNSLSPLVWAYSVGIVLCPIAIITFIGVEPFFNGIALVGVLWGVVFAYANYGALIGTALVITAALALAASGVILLFALVSLSNLGAYAIVWAVLALVGTCFVVAAVCEGIERFGWPLVGAICAVALGSIGIIWAGVHWLTL